MTQPGIVSRSPGPLANTLPTRPMNRICMQFCFFCKRMNCGNLPTHAWTPPTMNSCRYCSLAESNILTDSPGSRTETVSLVILSFVYVELLFFVNIFNSIHFPSLYFWSLTRPQHRWYKLFLSNTYHLQTSIWPMEGTLSSTTTPTQCGPEPHHEIQFLVILRTCCFLKGFLSSWGVRVVYS